MKRVLVALVVAGLLMSAAPAAAWRGGGFHGGGFGPGFAWGFVGGALVSPFWHPYAAYGWYPAYGYPYYRPPVCYTQGGQWVWNGYQWVWSAAQTFCR